METNRKELLKQYYQSNDFLGYYTDDGEYLIRIDLEEEKVYYTITVIERCGCCSGNEDKESKLDEFLLYMSDSDFEIFITELKNSSTEKES
jgi:hypothetical protein